MSLTYAAGVHSVTEVWASNAGEPFMNSILFYSIQDS